jgi:RNase P protein component
MLLNKFRRIYTRRHTGTRNRIGVTIKPNGSGANERNRARVIIKSSQVGRKQIKIWPAEMRGGTIAI